MEKKTIGGFISALRKANGMTQKDLAERLNVSDKTVSRWECDDGAPDLSLIPVIAEIFGVTCDELLRGERKSHADRAPDSSANEPQTTSRGEKQRQRILRSALAQYRTRTYIAMGISVIGLIAALICNLAFLRAVLGFLVGAVFFAAGIVCQTVFLNRAFFSVEDENGNVLCEYTSRNENVLRIRYDTDGDGSPLPITVYTYDALEDARGTVSLRNLVFAAAYILECAGVVIAYFSKRVR